MKRPPKPPTPTAAPAPAQRAPTYDDLLAIARLIESGSRFSEFRLRSGDIEVEVKRANGVAAAPPPVAAAPQPAAQVPPQETAPRPAAAASPGPADIPADRHLVRSPMVGTFYRAPAPDAPPFVEIGARVEADTIVCIIEVMKLMNSVPAGVAGVVTHIVAANAQPVEAGQAVIAIKAE